MEVLFASKIAATTIILQEAQSLLHRAKLSVPCLYLTDPVLLAVRVKTNYMDRQAQMGLTPGRARWAYILSLLVFCLCNLPCHCMCALVTFTIP